MNSNKYLSLCRTSRSSTCRSTAVETLPLKLAFCKNRSLKENGSERWGSSGTESGYRHRCWRRFACNVDVSRRRCSARGGCGSSIYAGTNEYVFYIFTSPLYLFSPTVTKPLSNDAPRVHLNGAPHSCRPQRAQLLHYARTLNSDASVHP